MSEQAPQDQRDGAASDAPSSVPSYARANVAALLPDYANNEQEAIRAAFQPNNYRSLKSLGHHDIDNGPFKVGKTGAGTFSDFAYVPSPYDLGDESKIRERLEHEERMRTIGGDQPFFAGYNASRLRHELDTGFEYMVDPYDEAEKAAHEARVDSESKRVARPFVPSGATKALARPTRAMLGDAMTGLYRTISEDWPEAPPTVLSTAEDLVVLYFSLDKLKSDVGVTTYMNNALRRNDAVIEFDLRKVPGAWGRRTVDGHIMFTFRPPWVRAQVSVATDATAQQPSQQQQQQQQPS
eukprot:CAMPEP_0174828308 /NCGR_PEP_ID=MMETSP1114-20130205/1251_1 /TAXON_ID=312471 /ORGANISM="Neobodo designis, Strain CCAP 1951/1" /LENGTH=295 /DNA_ID=CAMNT_0016062021 /DNA_START=34 /DNA_END=917 /DNA_ORIENTATION=-